MRNTFTIFSIIVITIIFLLAYFFGHNWYWLFALAGPILGLGFYDMLQPSDAIKRNFPVLGRGRQIMEALRPKIYQYFIESDINGTPINRINREIVYARAKNELDTQPFGTQYDVYEAGYEWMHHSIGALDSHQVDRNPKVTVGGKNCTQPYDLSVFNVSAMSFGSLSNRAIEALNGGAKIGGFAHNTGEGGISPYHLKHEGDLIYQIGTGYFGCRGKDGNFSPELYKVVSNYPSVKMIELKLSQGAKPGHGGILPARKNTPEIAKIRSIKPGQDVISPPYHKMFSDPVGLLKFIEQLRLLSNGKPVGFKLCVGARHEFLAICQAMQETGIKPDFITVDGGEGGTGAAPLEFTDSVGMPFREGLAFVANALRGFGYKKEIKILTSGKIMTGFDVFRAIAIGADACSSARAMMLALGCIQALECNQNTCPTGVATQKKELIVGLNIKDKKERVAEYHHETVHAFVELMAAAGLSSPAEIDRSMIYRRLNMQESQPYNLIYPYIPIGSLIDEDNSPSDWRLHMEMADPHSFRPKFRVKD